MKDFVYHGRLEGLQLGFSFAVTPTLASQAVVQHDCDPVSAHLFARALNAGVLCMHTLGDHEKLNLHWSYEGALRTLLVDLHQDGRIRGLISPPNLGEVATERDAIYGTGGRLNVVQSREARVLNSGTVDCSLQHVVRDLGYYFSASMQRETELNVMVDFTHDPEAPVALCQGVMLHALPEADLRQFGRIRERLFSEDVRELLAQPAVADTHFETVLSCLVKEEGVALQIHLEQGPVPELFCNCTEEKFRTSLNTLNAQDRKEILAGGEALVVRCEFCNQRYEFSPERCRTLWEAKS